MNLLQPLSFNEYVLATVVAVFVGDFIVSFLVSSQRTKIEQTRTSEEVDEEILVGLYPEQSRILGMVERALYVLAWFIGQPLFIGIWLTLKVAVRWSSWDLPRGENWKFAENGGAAQRARARYLIFVWGTGLSLLLTAWSIFFAKWFLTF